jgi:RNA polymerase sigma-70 factor (ECF subfamily)
VVAVPGSDSRMLADDAYVRRLYAEHGNVLLRYALHLTGGDQQRAEDILQEAFVRAWRSPPLRAGRAPRSWLLAVVRNLAIDAHRARQCRPVEADQAELEDLPGADDLDRAIESWDIADALASLRPEHRQVLIETYFRGCSAAEAASSLGIPVGTVKSRAFYALKALKLELQERGIAP